MIPPQTDPCIKRGLHVKLAANHYCHDTRVSNLNACIPDVHHTHHTCHDMPHFTMPIHLQCFPIVKRTLSPWGLLVALAGYITIQRRKLKKVSPSGSMLVSIPTLPTSHHISSPDIASCDITSHYIDPYESCITANARLTVVPLLFPWLNVMPDVMIYHTQ